MSPPDQQLVNSSQKITLRSAFNFHFDGISGDSLSMS